MTPEQLQKWRERLAQSQRIYEPKYGGKDHSGYDTLMKYEVNDEREDAFLAGMAAQHEVSRLIGMIEQARESAQGMEGVWLTDTLNDVEAYEAQLAEILAKGDA